MQQLTFFRPEPQKIIITKKHFAFILFVWWLLIELYEFVIVPSGQFVYENLIEQKSLNIYGDKKDDQTQLNSKVHNQNKTIQISENDVHAQDNNDKKVKQKKGMGKKHQKKQKQAQQTNEKHNLSNQQQNKQKFQINHIKKVKYYQQISPNTQDFKFKFNIKSKSFDKSSEQIKHKIAQQGLKIAMQEYFQNNNQQN